VSATRLELVWDWDWEIPQLLAFYEYVSVLAKPQATPLLMVRQRSQPGKWSRQPLWARDVLVVKAVRVVSQSAVAIEFVKRKWLGQLQKLMEAVW
jgi:hypothetical protein